MNRNLYYEKREAERAHLSRRFHAPSCVMLCCQEREFIFHNKAQRRERKMFKGSAGEEQAREAAHRLFFAELISSFID